MKVLVIGSGGREHAICWKLRADGSEVWCAPGSPGISKIATCLPIDSVDFPALIRFAKDTMIDFTVVGPEKPLSFGIVDAFREAGLAIVGPTKHAAQLESSKAFAKEIMREAGVPTAKAVVLDDPRKVAEYCLARPFPVVLKADGLAAGKGVVIVQTPQELENNIDFLFKRIGANQVLVEEFLDGVEATLIIATDGTAVAVLPTAHDYKRLNDGDLGPNTGGMGAISPTPRLSPSEVAWSIEKIVRPVLRVMKDRGTLFTGFLYAGLMIPREAQDRPEGIKVLEFNARLGDPECQAILPRMKSSFADLMALISRSPGSTAEPSIPVVEIAASSAAIVMASQGYPDDPKLGDYIVGLESSDEPKGPLVFHAGVSASPDGNMVTSGGRVLSVVAFGEDRDEAVRKAYDGAKKITFNGMHLRSDIGT